MKPELRLYFFPLCYGLSQKRLFFEGSNSEIARKSFQTAALSLDIEKFQATSLSGVIEGVSRHFKEHGFQRVAR